MDNERGMRFEKEHAVDQGNREPQKVFDQEWQHETCFRKVGLIAMLNMYYNKEHLGGDVGKD